MSTSTNQPRYVPHLKITEQEPIINLELGDDEWELFKITLCQSNSNTGIDVYVCYKNSLIQWGDSVKGTALTRFSAIITNQEAKTK